MLGPDHNDSFITRINLAAWLAESGQAEEAVGQFRRLLADQVRVLGPDHPLVLTTRRNLAHWLGRLGQTEEAVGQFRRLLEDDLRVEGPDAPATFITRKNLARWLGESGQAEEAVGQFRRLLEDQVPGAGPRPPPNPGHSAQPGLLARTLARYDLKVPEVCARMGTDGNGRLRFRSEIVSFHAEAKELSCDDAQ